MRITKQSNREMRTGHSRTLSTQMMIFTLARLPTTIPRLLRRYSIRCCKNHHRLHGQVLWDDDVAPRSTHSTHRTTRRRPSTQNDIQPSPANNSSNSNSMIRWWLSPTYVILHFALNFSLCWSEDHICSLHCPTPPCHQPPPKTCPHQHCHTINLWAIFLQTLIFYLFLQLPQKQQKTMLLRGVLQRNSADDRRLSRPHSTATLQRTRDRRKEQQQWIPILTRVGSCLHRCKSLIPDLRRRTLPLNRQFPPNPYKSNDCIASRRHLLIRKRNERKWIISLDM